MNNKFADFIRHRLRTKFILYLTNQEMSLILQSLLFSLFKKDIVTVEELSTSQFNCLLGILWKIRNTIGNCRLGNIVGENSLMVAINKLLSNFNAEEELSSDESTVTAVRFYGRKTVKLVAEGVLYRLFADKAHLFWNYSTKKIVTDIIQNLSKICDDIDLRGIQITDKIIQEIVDEWTIVKK